MTTRIVIDSGPLGLVLHPHQSAEHRRCLQWFRALLADGVDVVLPEIIAYEIRRVLIQLQSTGSIAMLDGLSSTLQYEPLTTATMRRAATFWADIRGSGLPTASDARLDIDVLLAAQASALVQDGDRIVIATTNVRHLSRFPGIEAEDWQTIRP